MRIIRHLLLHLCVACSFVCIAAMILDWYNPYMNFTGNIIAIQAILFLGVPVLAILKRP